MQGPLAGLRVVDASTILAGPLTCQVLGDFGADVVKVEHPRHGDGLRGHGLQRDGVGLWWKMLARNKRTVGLYLGDPDGAAVFRRLVAASDVVVENFRPGTMKRWGLGWDDLRAVNPDLVLLSVSAFGQEGPYRDRPGFGTLVEAMSGFAALTGEPDGPPTLPAFGLADSIAGIAGVAAVLAALRARDADHGGQWIDLDLLSPIMTAVGPGVIYGDQLGVTQERTGNRSTNNAPRNTYRTSDGHWVAVSTSANAVAERVMRLVGQPEVIDEPWFQTGAGRARHVDLLDRMVAEWIGARTRAEVLEAFAEAQAAAAPVYAPIELLDDPQVQAMELITAVEDDDLGAIRMQNVMWRMGVTPGSIRHTGRALGADTDDILIDELGYAPGDVAELRAKGILA